MRARDMERYIDDMQYAVVNAIVNSMRKCTPVHFISEDSTGIHVEEFSPNEDSVAMRNRLFSFTDIEKIDVEEEGTLMEEWSTMGIDSTCDFYELSEPESADCCKRMQVMIDPAMYVNSHDLRDMIVDDYSDLEAIEITEGWNGYPRNLRGAVIGCNYDKAAEIASMYGCSVVSVKRRNGWRLFECEGDVDSDFDMTAIYREDDLVDVFDDAEEFAEYIDNIIEDQEVYEEYEGLDDLKKLKDRVLHEDSKDKIFVVRDSEYDMYDLVERTTYCYGEDVWNYHIAIDCMIDDSWYNY